MHVGYESFVSLIHLVQGDGEGVPTSMSCAGGSVIRVLVAFYGNIMNGHNCRSTTVLAEIRSLCDQKQVCSFATGTGYGFGGDPCGGTPKYWSNKLSWACVIGS
jgi:hypothetical protein